jgi:uroporphyrinogen-III synthase
VLQGFTVGITSDRFSEEQARFFRSRGASVVVAPCLALGDPESAGALRAVTEDLIDFPPDAVVAATATAVMLWIEAAERWGIATQLRLSLDRSWAYARRPKVRSALQSAGLHVCPGSPSDKGARRAAVLLDGSGEAAELAGLRAAGTDVVPVASYRWDPPADRRPALRLAEGVIAGRIHAVVFTSRPAVANWFAIATEEGIHDPLRNALTGGAVTVGCVGPVCAGALGDAGADPTMAVLPVEARLSALVAAVGDRLTGRVMRYSAVAGSNGSSIRLAGTALTIGCDSYSLTPVEARLLAALVRSPNTVVGFEELAGAIWGGATRDRHLVDVVAARLRRRLGVHGEAIDVVPRRGYALRV